MMSDENDIGGKVGLDITDFKANVQELNRQIKIIDSGFKAAAAGMDDWSRSEEGLRSRINALNQTTDLQRQKVANLNELYKVLVETKGENSKEAQNLQVRINNETAALNKNNLELSTLNTSLSNFGKSTETTEDKISALDSQIKAVESGFKASASSMDDWRSSTDGLNSRIDSLNKTTDIQKQKIELLNQLYKKSSTEKGENAKETQDLLAKVNQETAALNKNELELKQTKNALNNFGQETSDTTEKTNKLHGALSKIGGGLANVGATVAKAAVAGIAAVGTAAAGAAVGAFKLASSVGETADDLLTMSAKTGISTKQLQEMSYASRFVDVDLETMTGSMVKLTKSMDNAKGGGKDAQNAFKQLGISITDNKGHLRDAQTVWLEAIAALGKMPNETERNALAMKLFGKSAAELNPLIVAGADELNRLGKEANNVGAVLSDEALAAAGKFDDMMQTLEASSKGLVSTLGIAVLPGVQSVVNSIVGIIPQITNAIKSGNWEAAGQAVSTGLNGLLQKLTDALPGLATMGSTIISNLVSGLMTAVTQSLPGITDAAVQLVNTLVGIIATNGPSLIDAGIKALATLISGILQALPQLLVAAIQILLALVNGISEQLPTLIPVAVQAILTMVQALIDNLPAILDAAIKLILALVDGIMQALPEIYKKSPEIVISLINGIVDAIPKLVDAAIELLLSLVDFLLNNLDIVIEGSMKIIYAVTAGLVRAIPALLIGVMKVQKSIRDKIFDTDWLQVGKDIIMGIVNGIKGGVTAIASAAKEAAKSALNAAKNFLGIHSPSRVMKKQVGMMIGAGMAEGITASSKEVNAAMSGLNKQVVSDGEVNIKSDSSYGSNKNSIGNNTSGVDDNVVYTIIKVPVNIEGKQVAEVTAPYSDKIQGTNLAIASRGVGLK
jgi:phage-related protein/predicted  nucleic acid-binding Zn-ribbon protein